MKKLVLFGAGKIGRSFIGQLFARSGYEVVFVDINQKVIDELNKRKSYKVFIKGEKEEVLLVENVRGVNGSDSLMVIEELRTASIAAVSVGQKGLPHILPNIAKALEKRDVPLDIIIAENMRNADVFIRNSLAALLPKGFDVDAMTGLIETSIGKMVPIMPAEEEEKDVLQVFAEAYNTLIVDKKAFKNSISDIEGLAPKENMKAWVDRKAFIHNYGHAVVAYIANQYDSSFTYLHEALAIPEIRLFTRNAMIEAAHILMAKYQNEFTENQLIEHIDDLLKRFENRYLGDTIYRVGCDLRRKLSRNDRVVALLMEGIEHHLPYENIVFTLACAYHFNASTKKELFAPDVEFIRELDEKGIKTMLTEVSEIPLANEYLIENISELYKDMNNIVKDKIKSLLLN